MSISVECQRCGRELEEPGGVVLSPPDKLIGHCVWKFHLCVRCFEALREWLTHKPAPK